jgi:hypothetical protein
MRKKPVIVDKITPREPPRPPVRFGKPISGGIRAFRLEHATPRSPKPKGKRSK